MRVIAAEMVVRRMVISAITEVLTRGKSNIKIYCAMETVSTKAG